MGAELSEGSLKPGVPNPPSVAFELPDGTLPLGYNYLPAVMQALAYYSDMLQYEQLATTTIEPPIGDQYVTSGIVQGDPVTTKKPNVSTPKPTTKPPPQRTTTRLVLFYLKIFSICFIEFLAPQLLEVPRVPHKNQPHEQHKALQGGHQLRP